MGRPFNAKRLLLTPQTWKVLLDVKDTFYPKSITLTGRMGDGGNVDVKLTAQECRHLSKFFEFQANRLEKKS